jgi:hypothetical protein
MPERIPSVLLYRIHEVVIALISAAVFMPATRRIFSASLSDIPLAVHGVRMDIDAKCLFHYVTSISIAHPYGSKGKTAPPVLNIVDADSESVAEYDMSFT